MCYGFLLLISCVKLTFLELDCDFEDGTMCDLRGVDPAWHVTTSGGTSGCLRACVCVFVYSFGCVCPVYVWVRVYVSKFP